MASSSPKVEKREPEGESKEKKTEETATPSSPPKITPVDPEAPAADDTEESDEIPLPDPKDVPRDSTDIIDEDTLGQIREMDEGDEDDDEGGVGSREFSRGIVFGFFDQAEQTFSQMQRALNDKDLKELSGLGHFLKGSSAALGIVRVQAICEKVQHYGANRDEEADCAITDEDALKRITQLLKDCKKDYAVAKVWLIRLYEEEE